MQKTRTGSIQCKDTSERKAINNEILLTVLLDLMQWRLGEVKP